MFVLEKRCASRSLTRARFCRAGDLLEVQAHFMQRRKYTSESPYDLAKMNIVIALFEQTPDRPRLCIVSSTNIQFVVYTYIYIYIHMSIYSTVLAETSFDLDLMRPGFCTDRATADGCNNHLASLP